jgi:hypothetical protein
MALTQLGPGKEQQLSDRMCKSHRMPLLFVACAKTPFLMIEHHCYDEDEMLLSILTECVLKEAE